MPSPDFWAKEAQLLYRVVFPLMKEAALDAAKGAIDQLEVEGGVDWTLVNEAALQLAERHAFELVTGMTRTTQGLVQDAVAQWIGSDASLDELIESLAPIFGAPRAKNVAVTEVTRVFAMANIEAWRASEVVEGVAWMTAEDDLVCPICNPLGDKAPEPLDALNFDGYKHPPAHPSCRCWLRPVVSMAKYMLRFGREVPRKLLRVA